MSDKEILKGNYEIANRPKRKDKDEPTLTERFEQAADEALGGSIAYVPMVKKPVWMPPKK